MSPYPVFPWPERARRFAQRITPVSVIVGLAIAFAANMAFANTPGHSITVNPNTNLNPAGHVVNVSGTGFAANQSGFIVQCIEPPFPEPIDCSENIGMFTTNTSGAFGPIPVTVTNPFTGVNSGITQRTCSAEQPCFINATLSNIGGFADEPISFATNGTTSTSAPTTSTTTTTVPPTTSTTTTTVPPTTSTTTTTVPPTTSTTTTTVPPTTSTTTTTVPPTTSTTTTTVPPTTSTTTTTVPPTTSTTTTTVPPTTSTTTTTVPPTTSTTVGPTTTTMVPPTTTTTVPPTTSTTVGPTTTTSTTAPVSPLCGRLLSQRAAINAQISAIQNGLPPSLPPDVRAQYIAQLEQIRDRANAQFDSALAAAGCPPAPTNG